MWETTACKREDVRERTREEMEAEFCVVFYVGQQLPPH